MSAAPRSLVVVVCLLVFAALAWWFASGLEPAAPAPHAPGGATPGSAVPVAGDVGREAAVAAAEAAGERTAVPVAPPPPVAPAVMRGGRVLDSRGQPLAAVPVAFAVFSFDERQVARPAAAEAVLSGALGEFELPAPREQRLPVAGEGWITLRATPCGPGPGAELLVVAARQVRLEGMVTGANALPLAEVTVRIDATVLREFPRPLEQTFAPDLQHAATGERGEYLLAEVPVAAGVDLVFARQGYVPKRVPTEQIANGRLDVALVTESGKAGQLHGIARDAQGPLAGVQLLLGAQRTESSASGEFTFEFPKQAARLLATARGYQPVVQRVRPDVKQLVVEFVRRALRIDGRVLLADGAPAVGWRVDLVDPVRGRDWRPAEADCSEVAPAVEGALAVTDAVGHFELGGLAERTYRLHAYDPETLVSVVSEPIEAGSRAVVLRVAADAMLAELRGIVVDRRGVPVAGAGLLAYLNPASAGSVVSGPQGKTDAEGRFLLRNVPRRVVQLGVSGEDIEYAVKPIEEWLRLGDLRIVVLRSCHVRIEGEADLWVQFLDGDGRQLMVSSQTQGMGVGGNGWTLRGGKSPVLTLAETAVTMVWHRDQQELGRKAVSLDPTPGAVTLLIAAK